VADVTASLPLGVNHHELAWALAKTLTPVLSSAEHSTIYIALGAGDTRTAITELTRVAARKHVTLTPDAVATLEIWRTSYSVCGGVMGPAQATAAPSPALESEMARGALTVKRNYRNPQRQQQIPPEPNVDAASCPLH
jgi:hypothetical protein